MSEARRRVTLHLLFVIGFALGVALCLIFGFYLLKEYARPYGEPGLFPASIPKPFTLLAFLYAFVVPVRYTSLILRSWLDERRRVELPPYPEGGWPSVAIISPVYKERENIERSLQSLDALTYPGKTTVIVVLDGEDHELDGTPELVRMFLEDRQDDRFVVLQKPNGGKASALNMGIAEARRRGAELVMCVDGDTLVQADAVERLAVHFQRPGIIAACGQCQIRNWLGATGVGEHGFPWWEGCQALEYCCGNGFIKRAQSLFDWVTIIPGPCGMFRMDILQEVASRTPRYHRCGERSHPEHGPYEYESMAEDLDLTLVLLRLAWKEGYSGISYEPRSIVKTDGRGRIRDLFRQRYRWMRGAWDASVKHLREWVRGFDGAPRRAVPLREAAVASLVATLLLALLCARGAIGGGALLASVAGAAALLGVLAWLRTDREPGSFLLISYFLFETLVWPVCSAVAVVVFVWLAIFDPAQEQPVVLIVWFFGLMGLDFVSSAFAVLSERQNPWLILYSSWMKGTYVLMLDTFKLIALADVFLAIPAIWHGRYVAGAPTPTRAGGGGA